VSTALHEDYNPLIVVTYADEILAQNNEMIIAENTKKLAQKIYLSSENVLLFKNYGNSSRDRNFAIDKRALILWDLILDSGNTFLSSQRIDMNFRLSVTIIFGCFLFLCNHSSCKTLFKISHQKEGNKD